MSSSVTVRAPAKINLSLGVGPLRDDGYHALATVYQAVGLYDEVTATAAEDRIELSLRDDAALVAGGDVPTDDRNLAVRAARLLAERTGGSAGVRLQLHKTIPVSGGMAGGSTDAAAALLACDALWGTRLTTAQLMDLAAELGSDVPFCLVGGTALGTGRGEEVSSLLVQGTYHWVVAVAHDGLSTPAVYAETDRLRAGVAVADPAVPEPLVDALRAGDAKALGAALSNDLQAAALSLRPELAELLSLGEACEVLGGIVSGSGPTCVFLANDEAHALDIGVGLASAGPCLSVHRVTGPVPGAQVVRA